MQENKLKLQSLKVGCIPIIDKIIDRMDLHNIFNAALKNRDYSDSLLILLKTFCLIEMHFTLSKTGQVLLIYDCLQVLKLTMIG